MSNLNSQLHRVGCSETTECLCGDIEAPQHYILKCPLYSAPRNKLLKAIREIIAPGGYGGLYLKLVVSKYMK